MSDGINNQPSSYVYSSSSKYANLDINKDGIITKDEIAAAGLNENIFEDEESVISTEQYFQMQFSQEQLFPPEEMSEEVTDMIFSQIEAKIAQMESEVSVKEDTKSGLGWLGNKISGLWGGGTTGEYKEIARLKALVSEAKGDISKISELYETVMGAPLSIAEVNAAKNSIQSISYLQQGAYQDAKGNVITQQDLNESLKLQAEALLEEMKQTVDNQGIISKGIGWANNFLDIGTTEKETIAKIENYQKLIEKLDNCTDPKEYAAIYKEITGENFNEESISYLVAYKELNTELENCKDPEKAEELKTSLQMCNKLTNSSAAEAIYDYKETQETALNAVAGTVSGILSGLITGVAATLMAVPPLQLAGLALIGAKYAISAASSAAINVAIKGIDGATSKEGYSWKQAGKDALVGALAGVVNIGANALGNTVTTKLGGVLSNKLGATFGKVTSKIIGDATDGALDGAVSGAGEYLLDCAYGDTQFSWGQLGKTTAMGTAFGGLTGAGMSAGGQLLGAGIAGIKKVKNIIDEAKLSLDKDFDVSTSNGLKGMDFNPKKVSALICDLATDEKFITYLRKAGFIGADEGLNDLLHKISKEFGIEIDGNNLEGSIQKLFTEPGPIKDIVSKVMKDESTVKAFKYVFEQAIFDRPIEINNPIIKNFIDNISDVGLSEIGELLKKYNPKQIQYFIEHLGVGPTKIAQIMSTNTGIMDALADYPTLQEALRLTKSDCSFSRTFDEAQAFVQDAFDGKVTLTNEVGAASIGAVYKGVVDGNEVIVKILKSNATQEQLDLENYLMQKFIRAFSDNPDELIGQVDQLYKDWAQELDFSIEYEANQMLLQSAKQYKISDAIDCDPKLINPKYDISAEDLTRALKDYQADPAGFRTKYADMIAKHPFLSDPDAIIQEFCSKRFSVAEITDISPRGDAIIMREAQGIKASKLVSILQDYQASPATFKTKYADLIAQYPWLGNPEKVIRELPTSMTKAFNDQLMFAKKLPNGEIGAIMHADPHSGNFFIRANGKGELIPEFIDTGLCVKRSSSQILEDSKFFMSYITGDAEGVAKYFVEQCDIDVSQKHVAMEQLADYINREIFGSGKNITQASQVISIIQTKLKDLNLTLNPEWSTSLKAELQFFQAVKEFGSFSGQSLDVMQVVKDLPNISFNMISNGINPTTLLRVAGRSFTRHPSQALGTVSQFVISRSQHNKILNAVKNHIR